MKQLTADERLAKVKDLLGFGGTNYHDNKIRGFIDEVIFELIDGGVKEEVAKSSAAVGCIYVGVNDLMNYTAGGVRHSDYFHKRLIQLAAKKGSVADVSTE